MKMLLTSLLGLAAIGSTSALNLRETGSDWGSPCSQDAQCGWSNGHCSMPFSNKNDPQDLLKDALLRVGRPMCNNGGCDCVVSSKPDLITICREVFTRYLSNDIVITNACIIGEGTVNCDGYTNSGIPGYGNVGTGPEHAGHGCDGH